VKTWQKAATERSARKPPATYAAMLKRPIAAAGAPFAGLPRGLGFARDRVR
jgi:hypothetical protein